MLEVSAPIERERSTPPKIMKAALRPIRNPAYVSVLHGIEMNVANVALQIGGVANGVFPISALPVPFSRFKSLLRDRGRASRPREKPPLIRLHRVAKSLSPYGKVQTA